MQQTLNFNSKQIVSKEELVAWDESLRELVGSFLRYSRSVGRVGGILDGYDDQYSQLINDFFYTELGSVQIGGFNTLKIGVGRGILDVSSTTTEYVSGLTTNNESLKKQLMTLLKWEATDNIEVDGIAGYVEHDVVYVGFVPIWNPLENGLCSLTTSNQVNIVGGDFTKLRGQSTKNPTKVRFYKEDGTPATNSDTYEVVSVVSSTQMVISGVLSAESNLKLLIVGSYDLSAQGSLDDKFAFVTANGQLTFTKTESNIVNAGGFVICSLTFGTGGAFTINDLRQANLFTFAYSPDIVYRSIAQTIPGQKTFITNPPIFGIATRENQDTDSFVTPLVPNGSNYITIPSDYDGRMIKVKANTIGVDDQLNAVYFTPSFAKGDHFFLHIDPTGIDMKVATAATASRIRVNNVAAGADIVLRRGSIVELIADNSFCWVITNSSPILGEDESWTQLQVKDAGGSSVDLGRNAVYMKRDGNTLILHIKSLFDYTGLYFRVDIPYTLAYQVVAPLIAIDSTTLNGRVVMNATGGIVYMYVTDASNYINHQIRAQLA